MIYSVFFSPTGGTEKVADIILSGLGGGKKCDIFRGDADIGALSPEDTVIFSMPCFSGRVPELALERMAKIKGMGARAVAVMVFGNRAIDDGLAEMQDLLSSCGFKVVAGIEAVAEHSIVRCYGEGRPDDTDKAELLAFCEKLKNAEKEVSLPGNRPYKERKPSSMKPLSEANCIKCGMCASVCPVGAINSDIVTDQDKCFACMRCVSKCPVGARTPGEEKLKNAKENMKVSCGGRKENKLYM